MYLGGGNLKSEVRMLGNRIARNTSTSSLQPSIKPMPAHRKPTSVLALTGSHRHNPARARARANEPQPTGEIGEPPETLSELERTCWCEIVAMAHPGTLCASDRLFVEHGAHLLALLRAKSWQVPAVMLVRWEAFLSKLGLTPADRSRVSAVPPHQPSPLDEFTMAGAG